MSKVESIRAVQDKLKDILSDLEAVNDELRVSGFVHWAIRHAALTAELDLSALYNLLEDYRLQQEKKGGAE